MRFVRYGPVCVRQGRTSRRPKVVVASALAVVVFAGGCEGGDGETTSTTTSAGLSTTTTLDAEVAAVLDAYRNFRAAYQKAADPPDPLHPDLPKHAADDALETVTGTILAWKSAGWVVRGTVDLAPHVVGPVAGGKALVEDCLFDRLGVYEAANPKKLVEPMDTARVLDRVTLMRIDGSWKVVEIERRKGETCTAES